MKNIAVLTTVFERPDITLLHMDWMKEFREDCKQFDIKIIPFYVLSSNDEYRYPFTRRLNKNRLEYILVPEKNLSNKIQHGLWRLVDLFAYDYLMHLDSDEFLSLKLMKKWVRLLKNGNDWIGSKDCYFLQVYDGRAWYFPGYRRHPYVNGGMVISRKIVEHCQNYLWIPGLDSGLNHAEKVRIQRAGFTPTVCSTRGKFGVLELKSGNDIHPMKWFQDRNYPISKVMGEKLESMIAHHPFLEAIIQKTNPERL